jgi:aspartyl-tRNA(Asn)/glutamyl-tRNA(Gln) amidotransferase subunit A
MTDDFAYMTATALAEGFAAKRFSPAEVTDAMLARIDALNPVVNAVCFRDDATTRAMAAASERRWMAGAPQGPLDGVPIVIKDVFYTKGWPTRFGSPVTDPTGPWQEDDPCVARLREQGAIFLGKTTLPEFATSGITDSPLTGVTVTPWDRTRHAGGSSGGTAAAVATGIAPVSPGNDCAGSIRTPASFCGVFGFKPSFGRVPIYPGQDFGATCSTGPIARSVRDAALMMNVIARPDARDWLALPEDGRDYLRGLEDGVRGLQVAISADLGYSPYVDPEIERIFRTAAESFATLGAVVEEASPDLGDPLPSYDLFFPVVAAALIRSLVPPERLGRLAPATRRLLDTAAGIRALDYARALDERRRIAVALGRFHMHYDLLLTPTDVVQPFDARQELPPEWEKFGTEMWETTTFPFNYSGQPAASVLCGFTAAGLPVGMQIVGRRHDDAGVLRAARALERAHDYAERRPPLSPAAR